MKLDTLLKRITPLPWKSVPGFHRSLGVQNDTYATHAANVLPELVEAVRNYVKRELLFMVAKTDFQQMPFDQEMKRRCEEASLEKGKAGQVLMLAVCRAEEVDL